MPAVTFTLIHCPHCGSPDIRAVSTSARVVPYCDACNSCCDAPYNFSHPLEKPLLDQMVDRFLGWKLPDDFNPDCGISFKRTYNDHLQPLGTNLFNAIQTKAMLEYVFEPLLKLNSPGSV